MFNKKLVQQGVILEAEIAAKTAELNKIKKQIREQAEFGEGKNTVNESFDCGTVKVARIVTVTWDQNKLIKARELDMENFDKLFKWEFKHNKINNVKNYIEFGNPASKAIQDAMTEKVNIRVSFEKAEAE